MFKLVNKNKRHDFYIDPDGPLFNIVNKDMPCGIGGYTSAVYILKKFGYRICWDREGKAREIFMGKVKSCITNRV